MTTFTPPTYRATCTVCRAETDDDYEAAVAWTVDHADICPDCATEMVALSVPAPTVQPMTTNTLTQLTYGAKCIRCGAAETGIDYDAGVVWMREHETTCPDAITEFGPINYRPEGWSDAEAAALDTVHRWHDELRLTECRQRDFTANHGKKGWRHYCALPKGHEGEHRCQHEVTGASTKMVLEFVAFCQDEKRSDLSEARS